MWEKSRREEGKEGRREEGKEERRELRREEGKKELDLYHSTRDVVRSRAAVDAGDVAAAVDAAVVFPAVRGY